MRCPACIGYKNCKRLIRENKMTPLQFTLTLCDEHRKSFANFIFLKGTK